MWPSHNICYMYKTLSTKFAELDEDESGKVSILELKNALLKKDVPYEDEMFDILDRDEDGLVTLDEYIKTYIEIQNEFKAKRKSVWRCFLVSDKRWKPLDL